MDEGSRREEQGQEPARERGSLWRALLLAFLALTLWGQWLGAGLAAEVLSADGSGLRVLAMLTPLFFGALAIARPNPALRLMVFPVSFLPAMALLTEREWAAMAEPGALLASAATFVSYLVVAAVGDEPRESAGQQLTEVHTTDSLAPRYRFFVRSRAAVVAGVLAVLIWMLFVDPEVGRTLVERHGERASLHLTFMSVCMLFAWVVMAYMAAVLPALNWEYERRQPVLTRAQLRLIDTPKLLKRRVAGWLVAAGVTIALGMQMVTTLQ
ncbi:hypothetical protein FRC98_05470 [Lujinxingia vulgaris]|uniref:Uncharacterized protein n=1 Tax=Lujinxingia vulgaris TaxID=2600176 RepID=A0A5C6XLX7_9DELT|nr:hypothetical protein [Lujinxingia vulgaris]TXD38344.1 hypothetical protein FRC98_05470 [Lujinxingia vulgaris]